MPAASQLDWLISMTAMIVLFWSRATRDLLKSFGWGIAALHRLHAATKLPFLAARPIASLSVPHARNNASFDPASRDFRTDHRLERITGSNGSPARTDHRLERITGSSVATPGRYAWAT